MCVCVYECTCVYALHHENEEGASEPVTRVADSCELWAVVAGSQTQLLLKSCMSFLMLSRPSCPLVKVLMLVWRLVTSTLVFYSVVFWVPDEMVIYIFNHIYLLCVCLCICVYVCVLYFHMYVWQSENVGKLVLWYCMVPGIELRSAGLVRDVFTRWTSLWYPGIISIIHQFPETWAPFMCRSFVHSSEPKANTSASTEFTL